MIMILSVWKYCSFDYVSEEHIDPDELEAINKNRYSESRRNSMVVF